MKDRTSSQSTQDDAAHRKMTEIFENSVKSRASTSSSEEKVSLIDQINLSRRMSLDKLGKSKELVKKIKKFYKEKDNESVQSNAASVESNRSGPFKDYFP